MNCIKKSNSKDLDNLKSVNDAIISIGIDWNKNAGTEFYVVGYFPQDKVWLGLDAINVSSSEFSARRWIKELINLNYKLYFNLYIVYNV